MSLPPFGSPPTPDATATKKGKVKLATDLGGSADAPQVVATHLASALPVSQGGTGDITLTAHGVVVGNGSSAANVTGAGTTNQVLASNGASADPTFKTITSNDASVSISGLDLSVAGTPLLNIISRQQFK